MTFVSDTDAAVTEDRCIWPGCTRPRAPGRASGSGRQKEYCLQADPPERGGGPVHNARNRWAALRAGGGRDGGAAGRAAHERPGSPDGGGQGRPYADGAPGGDPGAPSA